MFQIQQKKIMQIFFVDKDPFTHFFYHYWSFVRLHRLLFSTMPQKNVDKKSAKKSIFKKSPIRKLFQKKRSSKKISAQHKGSGKKHVIEANEVENQSKLQSQSVDIQKETESPKNRRSDLKRQTQAAKQVASEKARVEM